MSKPKSNLYLGRETPVQPLPDDPIDLPMNEMIDGLVGEMGDDGKTVAVWYRFHAEKKKTPLPWDKYVTYWIRVESSEPCYIGDFGPNPTEIDGQKNGLMRKPDKQGTYAKKINGQRQHPEGDYYIGIWQKKPGSYTIGVFDKK
jgi:hypothetical protein